VVDSRHSRTLRHADLVTEAVKVDSSDRKSDEPKPT
jgi:hypothetical protein